MTAKAPLLHSLPKHLGPIHIVGIGGIGMSGIAEILHNLGYQTQGSDLSENANVLRLRGLGIKVFVGQSEGNIQGASVVVRSSAVKDDNAEILAARKAKIPVIARAEMLAEIMKLKACVSIAGTHGKTTTTSLVASLFEAQELQPTVINGGIINTRGTNAYTGQGDWLVAEADESDGTFLQLPTTVGIVTNIDPEHIDHYGSVAALHQAFRDFICTIPFYGFAVLCTDHDVVASMVPDITDRRLITYGIEKNADVTALNIINTPEGAYFDVAISDHVNHNAHILKEIYLPMPGRHNILNALAAISVALELNFNEDKIRLGLANFGGVKRRFTHIDTINDICIVDDYAHHPTEITATLQTARQAVSESNKRVIAVFQPHRYSRIRDLFDAFCHCFSQADHVIVTDIFAAGEAPIPSIDQASLVKGIASESRVTTEALASVDDLAHLITREAKAGDLVVCMGAGSITNWANALPEAMKKLG